MYNLIQYYSVLCWWCFCWWWHRLEKAASDVTSYERERTKRVVYGVMYGAGREKLSEVLHITPSEASDIVSSFASKSFLSFIFCAVHTTRSLLYSCSLFLYKNYLIWLYKNRFIDINKYFHFSSLHHVLQVCT